MPTDAKRLIDAIQTGRAFNLETALEELKEGCPTDGDFEQAVNSTYSDRLDIAPLHVAAKAYAVYKHQPSLAKEYEAMCGMLIAAGASVWAEFGKTPKNLMGKTIAEEVGHNNLAPSILKVVIAFEEKCANWEYGEKTAQRMKEKELAKKAAEYKRQAKQHGNRLKTRPFIPWIVREPVSMEATV